MGRRGAGGHSSGRPALVIVRELVSRQRGRLALGVALLFVDRAAGAVLPFAPKVLLDEVVGRGRTGLVPVLGAAVLGAAVVRAGVTVLLARVLGLSAERVVLSFRRRLFARVLGLPASRLESERAGALVSRVMDDPAVLENVVGFELARWISSVLTAIYSLAALLAIDWRMTLTALAFAAVPGVALNRAHARMGPLFRSRAELRAEISARLAESLQGVRVVRAFGRERHARLGFARALHRYYRALASTVRRKAWMNGVAIVGSAGVMVVVMTMGARAMREGALSVGDFAMYVGFALMFAAPLLDLPDIAARASETLAHLDRMQELASAEQEPRDGAPVAETRGEIAFEGVTFAYGDRAALDELSFAARAGETTALVGASGAGKSTVFALLLRFFETKRGAVRVDGVDVTTLALAAHRARIAVVLQDDLLFGGTIAENIAFGRPRATREAIEAAAVAAHVDAFAGELPLGLDTPIGERGVGLSGGQRQRVAIARAVLADAPILLLDEATANLDAESEAAVRDALRRLRRGRTVIVIAHRLSTIREAERVVVLERGRALDEGTHDELLARCPRYRELCEGQVTVGGARVRAAS